MDIISFRQQWDSAADAEERDKTTIWCLDESKTIQDAPDSDINELMRRFGVKDGSILPASLGNVNPDLYGDFTDIPDLKTALDRVHNATEVFMTLPAKVRSRFRNNPWELHQWISDPKNIDEAVSIGLLTRQEPPKVPEAPSTPTPPAPGA